MSEKNATKNVNGLLDNVDKFIDSYQTTDSSVSNVEEIITIDKQNLDEEIIKNPARFAWISILSEEAKGKEALAKKEYESLKALTSLAYRAGQLPLPDGITKLTEGTISDLVESNDKVIAKHSLWIEARKDSSKLYRLVESLSQKSDMLRTFSSNVRKEMEADFTVKKSKVDTMVKKNKNNEGGDD